MQLCTADPQAVVDFAYLLAEHNGRVEASFHSHPCGQLEFSKRDDEFLSQWADLHLLLVHRDEAWLVRWGQSKGDDVSFR